MKRFLRYALCLPIDLPVWAGAWLLSRRAFTWRQRGVYQIFLPNLVKRFRATALGHTVFWWRSLDWLEHDAVESHELHHVEQVEGVMPLAWCLAVVLAVLGHWGLAVAALYLPAWVYASGWVASWLRGSGDVYRGNHLEKAARAVGRMGEP